MATLRLWLVRLGLRRYGPRECPVCYGYGGSEVVTLGWSEMDAELPVSCYVCGRQADIP